MKRSISSLLELLFLLITSAGAQQSQPSAESERQTAPVKITPDQFAKLVTKMVPPKFSRNSPQGVVVVRIVLDREGKLKNLQPISGNAMLVQAVTDAIMQWQFKPLLVKGEPAESEVQFLVNYTRAGS